MKMPDVLCSRYTMEQLFGEQLGYSLHQMIVGAILTDMDGRSGVVDLGHFDEDIVREMGSEWELLVRGAMAGDGVVK